MREIVLAATLGVLSLATGRAQDRNNDLGLVMGATVVPGKSFSSGSTASVNFDPSLVLGVDYDRLVVRGRLAALYVGGEFVAAPRGIKIANPPADLIGAYDYLFLTGHVRVKFGPRTALAPWLSFGGGLARFLETAPVANPAFSPGTNTGTLVLGGGFDTRPVVRVLGVPIGFRAEVRDFYSGLPKYDQTSPNSLQHNVVFMGGLLISF